VTDGTGGCGCTCSPSPAGEESLRKLEYDQVLELVCTMASSVAGKRLVASLLPEEDTCRAALLASQTREAADLLKAGFSFPARAVDVLEDILAALGTGAICLEPAMLRSAGEALSDLSRSRSESRKLLAEGRCRVLAPLLESIPDLSAVASELLRITTPDGAIAPDASSHLMKLTRTSDRLRESLSKEIGRLADSLSGDGVLRDIPPTVRNGRFVLPVLAGKRARVPGIVHDRSETGGTVFIEPQSLTESGNQLQEILVEVQQEQRRILRDATALLRAQEEALEAGGRAGAELDSVLARARFSESLRTTFPGEGAFALRGLRHPLLPASEVVANDLVLPGDWRVLIVSGPNAGGKSVLLKSAGLAVACARSGLGACADAGSTLPDIRRIRVSMGDSQSLVQKLSTYSARLSDELEMLSVADPCLLVLIDEPAAGTDPLPGAALAVSLLEALASAGARSIVTTHLGQLKTLASDHSGYYNGSMNFDRSTLSPDYTFRAGAPGSSYTLEIAGRMGFPEPVLSRAEALAGDAFVLDRLLADLAASSAALEEERSSLAGARAAADMQADELERLIEIQRADSEAAARQARERLEEKLREISSKADSLMARFPSGDAEERKHARAEIRKLAAEAAPPEPAKARGRSGEEAGGALGEGSWVKVTGWKGGPGRIEGLRGSTAMVRLGSVLVEKSVSDLEPARRPEEKQEVAGWEVAPTSPELDLRGMTQEEALLELDRRIDGCLASGVSRVRIIHGKGTGALMKAVTEFLRRDRRVAASSMAEPHEGGTGVTIANLRPDGGR
jgi:DNA mismatch repair protein MutS2